jgi:5'-3' exonuclease
MYLLFDLGYLLFYRYHATMRWIEFQKDGDTSPERILQCFANHLTSQLDKLRKKYKGYRFLFCQDEKHARVWRKEVYTEYKSTRAQANDTLIRAQSVIMDIVTRYGDVLFSEGLEADDVAYLTVKLLRRHDAAAEIRIITSDRDYLQMVFDDRIHLMDAPGKSIEGTGSCSKDLWMKILMGDKSDNIPPVCKGCGKKVAEQLADDPVAREEFIEKKQCRAELDRNRRLICMSEIPESLVNTFYEACKGIILRDVQM